MKKRFTEEQIIGFLREAEATEKVIAQAELLADNWAEDPLPANL